jgi:two-component system, NtrC family, sensor kinase
MANLSNNFDAAHDLTERLAQAAQATPVLLEPGTVLMREGEKSNGLWLIFDGEVELTRKISFGGATDEVVTLSDDIAGDIIGLLSVSTRSDAYFTATTKTPVRAVQLSWHQLDAALAVSNPLREKFMRRLAQSLGSRVKHVVDLQATVQVLNRQLRRTLDELEGAQDRLIAAGRMATIGQLVAGIAHELNNPVTAIRRSADHVLEDVGHIVQWLPEHEEVMAMITSALSTRPISTVEARNLTEKLGQQLQDEPLARRLVALQITSIADYRNWVGQRRGDDRDNWIRKLEVAYQLGSSLRNLQAAGERVAGVVSSLRSYAKAPQASEGKVDVNRSLEDTVSLFVNAHKFVRVEKHYGAVPHITGDAGQLNQVWTNIISNAIEAMHGQGVIEIHTEVVDRDRVGVRITDSGPGISPENIDRVFDLNFTTKHGPSSFGLGMGLALCKNILTKHGGHIVVESKPGRTSFYVSLPIQGPPSESPGSNSLGSAL